MARLAKYKVSGDSDSWYIVCAPELFKLPESIRARLIKQAGFDEVRFVLPSEYTMHCMYPGSSGFVIDHCEDVFISIKN